MNEVACLVYTVEDIQRKLFIGRRQAYNLVKSGEFPVKKICKSYRIPKESFDSWLYEKTGSCTDPADAGGAKK